MRVYEDVFGRGSMNCFAAEVVLKCDMISVLSPFKIRDVQV